MAESVTTIFEQALERYKAGESPDTLIPVFQDICNRAPKNANAWSCLAWLYLLNEQPQQALKAGQKAVKLDPQSPQNRVNLAIAMLETEQKGVRQHIELVQQMMIFDAQVRSDIAENIEDGLSRKADWKSLEKIKNWLMS